MSCEFLLDDQPCNEPAHNECFACGKLCKNHWQEPCVLQVGEDSTEKYHIISEQDIQDVSK